MQIRNTRCKMQEKEYCFRLSVFSLQLKFKIQGARCKRKYRFRLSVFGLQLKFKKQLFSLRFTVFSLQFSVYSKEYLINTWVTVLKTSPLPSEGEGWGEGENSFQSKIKLIVSKIASLKDKKIFGGLFSRYKNKKTINQKPRLRVSDNNPIILMP